MRHVGLVEAKVKALRTDAARRLVKMVLSKSTSKLGWSFNRWVRIVQHQRVEDYEAKTEEDIVRNAALKIKGYMRNTFTKACAMAWKAWVEYCNYSDVRDKNRFVGVDMIKRIVSSVQNRRVAAGFNSWVAALREGRKKDGEKKNGVR